MLKRISAYILDVILLVVMITGFAFLLSAVTGFDSYSEQLDEIYGKYEEKYNISIGIDYEEYQKLSEEEKANYDKANNELAEDTEANRVYGMIINLTLVITSISILLGYVLLEFIVPLIFKNGQIIGKKIFGIALMRTDSVKISTVMLFVRTILGKYTIETMIPVLIIIMTLFGSAGIIGTAVLLLIGVLQIVLLFATKTRSVIHDLLAYTVAVDMQSQMIFDSPEALLEYKKKLHEEIVADSEYK
jgi:uncharacterized RDD family membrane protein YckC